MYSKNDIFIFSIDIIHSVLYYYSMGIINQKSDNLIKLINGLSLLDNQDQERIFRMVDTLNETDENVKKEVFSNNYPLKEEISLVYADDEI